MEESKQQLSLQDLPYPEHVTEIVISNLSLRSLIQQLPCIDPADHEWWLKEYIKRHGPLNFNNLIEIYQKRPSLLKAEYFVSILQDETNFKRVIRVDEVLPRNPHLKDFDSILIHVLFS